MTRIVSDMRHLIDLFAARCRDRATMDELVRVLDDPTRWPVGHDLFTRIRMKNLAAGRTDRLLAAQYYFEEVCAKTIFNLSSPAAPFDADSPYLIVPNAFALARALNIDPARVLAIVAA